jgi:hypothetical protein
MFSVVSVVCCQVEVSTRGRSLVQRSPTKYGVAECDVETSTMSRLMLTWGGGGCSGTTKKIPYTVPLISNACPKTGKNVSKIQLPPPQKKYFLK